MCPLISIVSLIPQCHFLSHSQSKFFVKRRLNVFFILQNIFLHLEFISKNQKEPISHMILIQGLTTEVEQMRGIGKIMRLPFSCQKSCATSISIHGFPQFPKIVHFLLVYIFYLKFMVKKQLYPVHAHSSFAMTLMRKHISPMKFGHQRHNIEGYQIMGNEAMHFVI